MNEAGGGRADTLLGALIKRRIKEEEGAESARVLYVALTRASDMLYLCGKTGAQFGSWFHAFELLHEMGGDLAGAGWRAEIIRGLPEVRGAAAATGVESESDREVLRRRIAPVSPPDVAPATISVSRLLALMEPGSHDAEERPDEDRPRIERDGAMAMDRGTLVHRMFEVWDFAGEAGPDITRLVRDARLGLENREKLAGHLAGIQKWFAASPLGARLRGEVNLQREAPFSLRIGATTVNGTVDLLLEDGTIVDYKTGKIKAATRARYETQLLLYAAALQALTGTAPEKGMLVYVDAREWVEVPLTPARIAATLDAARAALS